MTTTSGRTQLSDAQLGELLNLAKQSDSVELKLTVPEAQQRATIGSLGMDPLQAIIRQVFFFDTPDLTLDAHGVVVRARRTQNKPDDSVVKLRPVVPSDLPDELRRSGSCKVEVDVMPGGFVCSASLSGAAPPYRRRGHTQREASNAQAVLGRAAQLLRGARARRRRPRRPHAARSDLRLEGQARAT